MNMHDSLIRVLLIEDDPGDARLIEEMLKEPGPDRFKFVHEKWLDAGIEHFESEAFDVLLLDLMLPESRGLDTLFRITNKIKSIPIVVLTGLSDEIMGIKAINHGAQDYLVKGDINSELLVRSIRHAIERNRLLMKLKRTRKEERKEQERLTQHYLAISQEKGQTQKGKLDAADDEVFKKMVPQYRDIVLSYVRAIRIREDRPSEKVRLFAGELVKVRARAKDIMRIHLHVLNEFSYQIPSQNEERNFSNDARLVLVELMGNLLDMYRLNFLTTEE